MAALASPTPIPFTSNYGDLHYRRPLGRNFARPASKRPYAFQVSPQAAIAKPGAGDSSDDEDLAPIKLSAEAQAILGEDNSQGPSPKASDGVLKESAEEYRNPSDIYNPVPIQAVRQGSLSPGKANGSPAPRVVRLASGVRPTALAAMTRDGSFMYKTVEKIEDRSYRVVNESKTPAGRLRSVRVTGSRSKTRSPPSTQSGEKIMNTRSGSSGQDEEPRRFEGEDLALEEKNLPGDQIPIGPSTIMRPRRMDDNHLHSTTRVKRFGAGTLLNGPIRRGMIRRQSEEDDVQEQREREEKSPSPEMQQGRRAEEPELDDRPDDFEPGAKSPQIYNSAERYSDSQPANPGVSLPTTRGSLKTYEQSQRSPSPQAYVDQLKAAPTSRASAISSKSSSSKLRPIFSIPSLPPLPSVHDQENEPPPTFKRTKPSVAVLGEAEKQPSVLESTQRDQSLSPHRQVLAARSLNTPHRPAPAPPPKMSLIEAATSNAGSSRRPKNVNITINGRQYKRLDCIGRGGSSRVYRIMAENFKIFAVKRVSLEDADMAAITGYKGEIDLLRKLENVDRVIRLFDYEVNEEKQSLSVMMELGESDFNKMLNEQIKTENARLDISFTRYYWKEMLECVQAVHAHGIVHSDLKPANFLLVRGQLKLIDFGIANAIQDNTVNVHRENQIGTPNYMSPESLVCHAPAAGAAAGTKLLKLGKPSDVWSLGCILYQMTYGQPPFAHITKQFERIMSIPNPKVEIQFPSTGVGGAVVPFGLIKTLRRCLQREQSLRPTIQELLNDTDPFLNPVAISADMLGRMISNVVGYCRKKEDALRASGELSGPSAIPTDADMKAWPLAFYDKLRQAQEEGTAW